MLCRPCVCTAMAVIAAGAASPAAVAQLSMSGSSQPAEVRFPGPSLITYSLVLGRGAARPDVRVVVPRIAFRRRCEDRGAERRVREPRRGTGNHRPGATTRAGQRDRRGCPRVRCAPARILAQPPVMGRERPRRDQLEARLRLRSVGRQPVAGYRVRCDVRRRSAASEPVAGDVAEEMRTTIRGPRATGVSGIRLTLASDPATRVKDRTIPRRTVAKLRVGQRVALRGTTLPRLRDARVSLHVKSGIAGRRRPSFQRAVTVRTDAAGRFRAAVIARRPGGMEVQARVSPPSPRFAEDQSCSLEFDVLRPRR